MKIYATNLDNKPSPGITLLSNERRIREIISSRLSLSKEKCLRNIYV